jgi:2,3-bisphosphoglycerate-dependent phosphoglycerate mutase
MEILLELCANTYLNLDENQIAKLEIPTGNPLLIEINENLKILNCKYLDKERAKDLVVY